MNLFVPKTVELRSYHDVLHKKMLHGRFSIVIILSMNYLRLELILMSV
jgi:hypothetical protein